MRNIFSRILDRKFPHRQPPLNQSKAVTDPGFPWRGCQLPKCVCQPIILQFLLKTIWKQECIPVGCIPPTAVAVGGEGVRRGAGPDPPQFPPWVWAWTWSPSISPLGVGLDLIPLNFPLGCGPGPDPPQFSPFGVGLDLIPLNFLLRCGPGPDPPQFPPWVWAWRPPPPGAGTPVANRILDTRLWKYYVAPNFVWGR